MATYDHMNLPLSFTRGGVTTAYRYGPAAQRIAKRVGTGNTEVYLREGPLTLAVFTVNGSGVVQSHHFNVVSGERVVGRRLTAGGRRYYHTDLLGSTRTVVDSLNVVREAYDYDPWGVLMPGRTLGSGTKEGFTGKERDAETGLDYFGFRYYMSAIGRWTSVDPPADEFPEWSPYNYVYNNPVLWYDLAGLCPVSIEVTLCIDFFIMAEQAGILQGDNRDHDASAPPEASRAQIVINVQDPTASTVTVNETCSAGGGLCRGALDRGFLGNNVSIVAESDGSFTVELALRNSLTRAPAINGIIRLTPTADGGFESSGSRDAFPSVGIYMSENNQQRVLREQRETHWSDLLPRRGKDRW